MLSIWMEEVLLSPMQLALSPQILSGGSNTLTTDRRVNQQREQARWVDIALRRNGPIADHSKGFNTVHQLRSRQSLSRKKSAPGPQRDIDEADHHRHLDQWTDNGSKGRARIYAVDGDRNRNRQLEIVAGGGE